MEKIRLKNLSKIVKAPEFMVPWLDRFYEPREIRFLEGLMQNLSDTPPSHEAPSSQKAVQTGPDNLDHSDSLNNPDNPGSLDRLLKRGVVSLEKDGTLEPADFHVRYDIWALFEGFKDIPDRIRERLNRWELGHYMDSHAGEVQEIRKTGTLDPSKILPRYLLLDEAFEVLDQVDRVYLWPCNCRSMMDRCSRPVYTCLRFDNSRGQGYEISRERAKQIVVDANRQGLMQSGELGRDGGGRLKGAICNCCPDCCFPHLLARDLKAEKLWPLSRYTAVWQENACNFCGKCAKRCPFQAFFHDRSKENKQDCLTFNEALCRGCGLCAVTCPTTAITMKRVK